MLIVTFDYLGIVHHELVPGGQTVMKEYYLDVLRHLHDETCHKPLDVWASQNSDMWAPTSG